MRPNLDSNYMRSTLCAVPLAAMLSMPAQAYPIDCAILLCLAGGFPASAECSAAKAEMIRRITPFPIEPPLQLWNCPMRGAGSAALSLGSDGLPPEVRAFRDGIDIYHIDYRQSRGGGDVHIFDRSRIGQYDAQGEFRWARAEMQDAPDWVFASSGVNPDLVRRPLGRLMRWRGVLMRWRDHQARISTEWLPY